MLIQAKSKTYLSSSSSASIQTLSCLFCIAVHLALLCTWQVAELLKFLDDSLVDEDDVPADARPLEVFEEIKSEPEASFQHLSAPGAQPRAR